MANLIIKKIILKDWRTQNREVSFNDRITSIYAKNGLGKTSIQQAWNWMLTGRTDPNHIANFGLFDNKVPTTKDTPIASVEAVVSINGIEYTLQRTARSKYVKERGKDTYVKASSDEYKLYIDGIETSATNWEMFMNENICHFAMLPYLLSGDFFGTLSILDKKKARAILLEISDKIDESDFNGDYSIFSEYLKKKYSVDMIEESASKKLKKIAERQNDIQGEKKLKESSIAEYKQVDYDYIRERIESLNEEVRDIDKTILGSSELINPLIKKRDSIINEINLKLGYLGDKRFAYESGYKSKKADMQRQINDVNRANSEIQKRNAYNENEFREKESKMASLVNEVESLKSRREELLKRGREIKDRIFNEDKCSYCGQELPIDMIEENRKKFNEQKLKDLEYIKANGKSVRARIDSIEETLGYLSEEMGRGFTGEDLLSTKKLEDKLKEIESNFIPYENTDEYKKLNDEIEDLRKSVPTIPSYDNKELTYKKREIMDELAKQNKELGLESQIVKLEGEVENLKEEYNENALEMAHLESVLEKVKEYRQERNALATKSVNANLDGCYFDIFSLQKDGKQVDDLVLKASDGVHYATINNSNRMKMNIELQKMFMRRFNTKMPIFVDEAQAFDSDNLPHFDGQCIYMYVSDDKKLIVK